MLAYLFSLSICVLFTYIYFILIYFNLFSFLYFFINNILLSINPFLFLFVLRLLHYFDYKRLFLPFLTLSVINVFFSQFPHLHLISRFVLSLFCRISSRCTNRTQSIHPPPYLVPLLRTSIPTTTLDSDPPIS